MLTGGKGTHQDFNNAWHLYIYINSASLQEGQAHWPLSLDPFLHTVLPVHVLSKDKEVEPRSHASDSSWLSPISSAIWAGACVPFLRLCNHHSNEKLANLFGFIWLGYFPRRIVVSKALQDLKHVLCSARQYHFPSTYQFNSQHSVWRFMFPTPSLTLGTFTLSPLPISLF